ncbi:uncharacterized protein LOC129940967 [Eupeodes corollae]|uniref:uncharacterized protein LOC129940967 n=1 Tax=Eupeodes corollae TaxID=290404 RepID=UPI00249033C0|nr:uncharacterized protein LOC129940967 [Eupeodes corollae]
MKYQALAFIAFLVVLSCCVGAQSAIGGYDYCGKPCTERSGIVCAYNQNCFTFFNNICDMRKRNCDHGDRFNSAQMSSCLFGQKCRGI